MVDFYINLLEMNSKTCLDVAEDGDDHGRPKSAILLKGYQIWHFLLDFQATRAGEWRVTAELWLSKCLYPW